MISIDEFVERLCIVGASKGPRRFPRKPRDRDILAKSILLGLDSGDTYDENEINEVLLRWNSEIAPAIETDHVSLRRTLVDYGYLERRPDGTSYRVGFPPASVVFDLEIDDLDLRSTVIAFLDYQQRQTREGARRAGRTNRADS